MGVIAGTATAGAALVGLSATSALLFWKKRKRDRLLAEQESKGTGAGSSRRHDEDLEEETYVEIHDVSDEAQLAAGGDENGYTEIDNSEGGTRRQKPPLPRRDATGAQGTNNGDNPYDQANSSSEDIRPGPSASASRKKSHNPNGTEAPYDVCQETEAMQRHTHHESEGYTYPGSRDSKRPASYLTPMPSLSGPEQTGSLPLATTDVNRPDDYLTPALEQSETIATADFTRADNYPMSVPEKSPADNYPMSVPEKSPADYYLTPASEKRPTDYYLTPVSGQGEGQSADSTKDDYLMARREGSMPAADYLAILPPSSEPDSFKLNKEMEKAGYLTPVHLQSTLKTPEVEATLSQSSDSMKKAGYLTPVDMPSSPVSSHKLAKREPSSDVPKTSGYLTPVEVLDSQVVSQSQEQSIQSSDVKKPHEYLTAASTSPPKKDKKKSSMIPLADFWSSKRLSPNRKSPPSSEGETEAHHTYEKITSVKHTDPSNDPSYRKIGDVIMAEQTNPDTSEYHNC